MKLRMRSMCFGTVQRPQGFGIPWCPIVGLLLSIDYLVRIGFQLILTLGRSGMVNSNGGLFLVLLCGFSGSGGINLFSLTKTLLYLLLFTLLLAIVMRFMQLKLTVPPCQLSCLIMTRDLLSGPLLALMFSSSTWTTTLTFPL